MVRRTAFFALVAVVLVPSVVAAQQSRVYVDGTFTLVTQTHSDREPLGGTIGGGSFSFGVQVAERVALEFEPSFSRRYSWEYTYRPSPSLTAVVVPSRRDTFFSFQLRTRLGVLEPVLGASYVHGTVNRHATIRSTTYFDDSRADPGVAAVGGVDAALPFGPRFYFVPSFRVFLVSRVGILGSSDALGEQTSTGPLVFRYGAGARVAF